MSRPSLTPSDIKRGGHLSIQGFFMSAPLLHHSNAKRYHATQPNFMSRPSLTPSDKKFSRALPFSSLTRSRELYMIYCKRSHSEITLSGLILWNYNILWEYHIDLFAHLFVFCAKHYCYSVFLNIRCFHKSN